MYADGDGKYYIDSNNSCGLSFSEPPVMLAGGSYQSGIDPQNFLTYGSWPTNNYASTAITSSPYNSKAWPTKISWNPSTISGNCISSAQLLIDGNPRFPNADGIEGNYFQTFQPFYYFNSSPQPGIYLYSFSLQPNEYNPSGSLNFTTIDSVFLKIQTSNLGYWGSSDTWCSKVWNTPGPQISHLCQKL